VTREGRLLTVHADIDAQVWRAGGGGRLVVGVKGVDGKDIAVVARAGSNI